MKSKDEYNESSDEDETPVKAKSQNNGVQQTDLAKWKKFNRLEQKTKVFIIKGGYHDLRRALVDRGWVENTDYSSPCFDFKWTCKVAAVIFSLSLYLIFGLLLDIFLAGAEHWLWESLWVPSGKSLRK